MSTTSKNMLASRAATMASALLLFAGLTAPFLILQSTHALADAAPLACTEGNHNGCTELSAMPPEDMQAVPPNLVLMLDDSGSMAWDYMPDWDDLANNGVYGTRNSGINYVYYNPTATYIPPPKATAASGVTDTAWQSDGTWYPNSPSMIAAYRDGFTNTAALNIVGGGGYVGGGNGKSFNYTDNLATTLFNTTPAVDKGAATWGGGTPGGPGTPGGGCIGGYHVDPGNSSQCIRNPIAATHLWTCNAGDGSAYNSGGTMMCHHRVWEEGVQVDHPYNATDGGYICNAPSVGPTAGNMCTFPAIPTIAPTPPTDPTPDRWQCLSGGSFPGSPPGPPSAAPECWTSGTSTRIYVRAFTYVVGNPVNTNSHYVIPNVTFNGQDPPAGGWCGVLNSAWQKANCVNADDTTGKAAPAGISADQNIANWFSYYRTRLLMAKSSLMTAFRGVDPKYRFGFASINGNGITNIPAGASSTTAAYGFDDSTADGSGGNSSNKLAAVQPFGDGSSGTQKAQFWNWLANVTAAKTTPLRKALNAVGQYYSTANPWKTMQGDPGWTTGSTTNFTCRSSYTILTTDGFWNGDPPTDPSGLAGASSVDGPVQVVPTGSVTQYLAKPPYNGGGIAGDVTLADIATYYWERDLNADLNNEIMALPTDADPASWQHMTTFTVGLGYPLKGVTPTGTSSAQIFGWANGGAAITGFSWPTPGSDSIYNIADLAHAGVNGHGDFFNANNSTELAEAFAKALSDIGARNAPLQTAGVNASVLSLGAAAFKTVYTTAGWSGTLQAVALNADGTVSQDLWDAGTWLTATYHSTTGYSGRSVYTGAYTISAGVGSFSAFQFNAANSASLDTTETAGLQAPALAGGSDTLNNRINYLLGDITYESATGAGYRPRTNILGAIIHSGPAYVTGATGNYRGSWPNLGVAPPETATGAQTYDTFVNNVATREPMVYIGANDGMLHAFHAPVATCTGTVDTSGNCSAYTWPDTTNQGQEAFAFIPRAVYANLGNLTNNTAFQFRPTVDSTPVTRDVYFSGDKAWHTLLTGGVGVGGRGIYALDITDPSSFSASNVLWEFDADMPAPVACVTNYEAPCRSTDLGYTVSQPNVGRLANGKWVVLVSNGYFPDCGTPDAPTGDVATCNAIAAQVPKYTDGTTYSSLFVLDAETGKMLAELKTPKISGVTSFGLARAVLGDYTSDQVDDVAFAGDVQGNLWRFDLSSSTPSDWSVSLVYKGVDASGVQGQQPITTMPRLFPDPGTNRFLVLFGTGKYLGVGDNTSSGVQAVYAVRDTVGTTWTKSDLTRQYLHEAVIPSGQPNAGATLRCVTGSSSDTCTSSATPINSLPGSGGGWYVNLYTTDAAGTQNNGGERIVVNPGAIFASNTVIFESMITGASGSDACAPTIQGAILALNATTGGSAGMSSLGGWPTAGARINSARTSGSLPVVSALGGGKAYLPGATLAPSSSAPISLDAPIWRRRSWRVLMHDQ